MTSSCLRLLFSSTNLLSSGLSSLQSKISLQSTMLLIFNLPSRSFSSSALSTTIKLRNWGSSFISISPGCWERIWGNAWDSVSTYVEVRIRGVVKRCWTWTSPKALTCGQSESHPLKKIAKEFTSSCNLYAGLTVTSIAPTSAQAHCSIAYALPNGSTSHPETPITLLT